MSHGKWDKNPSPHSPDLLSPPDGSPSRNLSLYATKILNTMRYNGKSNCIHSQDNTVAVLTLLCIFAQSTSLSFSFSADKMGELG